MSSRCRSLLESSRRLAYPLPSRYADVDAHGSIALLQVLQSWQYLSGNPSVISLAASSFHAAMIRPTSIKVPLLLPLYDEAILDIMHPRASSLPHPLARSSFTGQVGLSP